MDRKLWIGAYMPVSGHIQGEMWNVEVDPMHDIVALAMNTTHHSVCQAAQPITSQANLTCD